MRVKKLSIKIIHEQYAADEVVPGNSQKNRGSKFLMTKLISVSF